MNTEQNKMEKSIQNLEGIVDLFSEIGYPDNFTNLGEDYERITDAYVNKSYYDAYREGVWKNDKRLISKAVRKFVEKDPVEAFNTGNVFFNSKENPEDTLLITAGFRVIDEEPWLSYEAGVVSKNRK